MANRINKKIYYKLQFDLASPLLIGNGESRYSDNDVVRNSKGKPYIPGSALAGINRAQITEQLVINAYFGEIKGEEASESKLLFYDANLTSEDAYITLRDSVALDEYKTAIEGAKFDMEVLETGAGFVTYIEQNVMTGDDENFVETNLLGAWLDHEICIGAKTTRGYGAITNVKVWKIEFNLLAESDAVSKELWQQEKKDWLKFDMYEADAWKDAKALFREKRIADYQLMLTLKQDGGISITRPTTEIAKLGSNEVMPDKEQLTLKDGVPVIPGTSWAGAFRHRIAALAKQSQIKREEIEGCFGTIQGGKKKSKVRFSETQVIGAKEKCFSRNAIDRFTGGTVDKALFTDKTYYGGETTLVITFETEPSQTIKKLFAAAIADLHGGYLAVGGLTAVGRGLFKVTQINGVDIAKTDDTAKAEDVYKNVCDVMEKWSKK